MDVSVTANILDDVADIAEDLRRSVQDLRRLKVVAGVLLRAIASSIPVEIKYTDRRGEGSSRVVHAYDIFESHGDPAIHAWCLQAQAYRTFKLDRIKSAFLREDLPRFERNEHGVRAKLRECERRMEAAQACAGVKTLADVEREANPINAEEYLSDVERELQEYREQKAVTLGDIDARIAEILRREGLL